MPATPNADRSSEGYRLAQARWIGAALTVVVVVAWFTFGVQNPYGVQIVGKKTLLKTSNGSSETSSPMFTPSVAITRTR